MAEKLFYTMGEVAEMFDVNASLIRYWGTQFPSLKPQRNKKGNRLFSPEDIETLKLIYHYVKECGMTLEGAKKALRGSRAERSESSSDIELLDRLHTLRSTLIAVRDSLGEGGEPLAEPEAEDAESVESIQQPTVEQIPEPEPQPAPAPEPKEEGVQQPQFPVYKEQTLFDF